MDQGRLNWTPDGRLRHPSWRGLRLDKSPADAVRVSAPMPEPEVVEAAMQTPDGQWRVEIVRRGASSWYGIVHGDDHLDWLSLDQVETILGKARGDRQTLVQVEPVSNPPAAAKVADPTAS